MGMGTCSAGHVETNLQTRGSDFYGEKAGVSEGRDTQLPIIHANSSKGGERNLIFLYRHATSLWHLIAADCVFCVSGVNILSSAQCQHCGSKPGLTAGGLGEAAWQHPVHQVSTVSDASGGSTDACHWHATGWKKLDRRRADPAAGPAVGSAAPPLRSRTRGTGAARCPPAPRRPRGAAGEARSRVPAAAHLRPKSLRPVKRLLLCRRPGGGGPRSGSAPPDGPEAAAEEEEEEDEEDEGEPPGGGGSAASMAGLGGSAPPLPARRPALRLHARGETEGDGREAARAPAPPSPAAGKEVRPRTGGPGGRTDPTAPPAASRAQRTGHLLP